MLQTTLKIGATIAVLSLSTLAAAQAPQVPQTDAASDKAKMQHMRMSVTPPPRLHKIRRAKYEIVVVGTVDRSGVAAPTYKAVLPKIELEFSKPNIIVAS